MTTNPTTTDLFIKRIRGPLIHSDQYVLAAIIYTSAQARHNSVMPTRRL